MSLDAKKIAAVVIKDLISDHNLFQWEMARREQRKPELLPALVGVDEVIRFEMYRHGDFFEGDATTISRQTTYEVRAKYRVYYSRRDPGSFTARHRFHLGRVREGIIRVDVRTSDEGSSYTIEYPDLKLKYESG